MNRDIVIAFAACFVFGVAFACLVLLIMRETFIERAIDRREREIYGPLLERVQAQEIKAREVREAETRAIRVAPVDISLDKFPIPRQRHHIRVR